MKSVVFTHTWRPTGRCHGADIENVPQLSPSALSSLSPEERQILSYSRRSCRETQAAGQDPTLLFVPSLCLALSFAPLPEGRLDALVPMMVVAAATDLLPDAQVMSKEKKRERSRNCNSIVHRSRRARGHRRGARRGEDQMKRKKEETRTPMVRMSATTDVFNTVMLPRHTCTPFELKHLCLLIGITLEVKGHNLLVHGLIVSHNASGTINVDREF